MKIITKTHLLILFALLLYGCINPFGEWRSKGDYVKMTLEISVRDIVFDGHVISAPNVNDAITGGRSSIIGNFDVDEALGIASMLRSGSMPAVIKIVEEEIIDPKAK